MSTTQPKVKPVNAATKKSLKISFYLDTYTPQLLISVNKTCWIKLCLVYKGTR